VKALCATLLSALVLLACGPREAGATLSRLPVRFELRPDASGALAGQPFTAVVEIESAAPVVVDGLRIVGDGWTIVSFAAPATFALVPGRPLRLSLTATPDDPGQPLTLLCEVEGRRARQTWRVSAAAIAAAEQANPLRAHDGPLPAAGEGDLSRPGPAPRPDAVAVDSGKAGAGKETPDKAGRTITVRGRFVYERLDAQTVGAFGVTAHVFDDDGLFDQELATTTTGADGSFEVDFYWQSQIGDDQPDLRVEFWSENDRVKVRDDWLGGATPPSKWTSTIRNDYAGTLLDLGTTRPSNDDDMPVLHILTNLTRTWSYIDTYAGRDVPLVTAIYPTEQWPAYNPFFHDLYIPRDYDQDPDPDAELLVDFQWRDATHVHEYGHHVINTLGQTVTPDYCNGNCDEELEGWPWEIDCGHCLTCSETDHDAWSEGWPNWLADLLTRRFETLYGLASLNARPQEDPFDCLDSAGDACDCNVFTTEGFVGLLLRDIEDADQDDHDPADGVEDVMIESLDEIFTIALVDDVTTVQQFLDRFRARWPERTTLLWETARNVGYEIDVAAPGAVASLASASHPLVGDSPDATPKFTWTPAVDDASGIAGYDISVDRDAPRAPGLSLDIPALPASYTHGTLAPGTWYFTIRAIDRAGRPSTQFATYGPFAIRPAAPADLQPTTTPGWAGPVVPRSAPDANNLNVPAATALTGNALATWVNLAGVNAGEAVTPVGFSTHVLVDGALVLSPPAILPIEGGSTYFGLNMGPVTVRGGRHTMGAFHDANELVNETDETDNSWAGQWVWSPFTLATNTLAARQAPPDRDGGWDDLPLGVTRIYNCDGLRFLSDGSFTAVSAWPQASTADYDVRIHTLAGGTTDGFRTVNLRASSLRPAGALDAVIVNLAQEGSTTWDVGVLNAGTGTSTYSAVKVTSGAVAFGASSALTMAADRLLMLRHVDLLTANLGQVAVSLDIDPAHGRLQVAWLTPSSRVVGLDDFGATAVTDALGDARLLVNATATGRYAVVVWRDPADLPAGLPAAAAPFTLRIESTPPDLAAATPVGWHAPLVPRPGPDGTPAAVPAPTALTGGNSTWLHAGVTNISPAGAPASIVAFLVDGATVATTSTGTLAAGAAATWTGSAAPAVTVPGGRHTLTLRADATGVLAELTETNNVYGEQWSWRASTLAFSTPVSLAAPPVRTAGWSDVTTGEALYFNCLGLRVPAPAIVGENGWWTGIAVMPESEGDIDVRLHEILDSTKQDFRANLVTSLAGGGGEIDFVLVNYRRTTPRALNAGVLRDEAGGAQPCAIQAVASQYVGTDPRHITASLAAGRLLALHEMTLSSGHWQFALQAGTAPVDWGFSLHDGAGTYADRAKVVDSAAAWLNPEGEDEAFDVHVTQPGTYVLAVWRASSRNQDRDASYRVTTTWAASATGPDLPTPVATTVTSVRPNPFNPRTTIAYDLTESGPIRLAVYNARGELVRTLVDGLGTAGSHAASWDGRDEAGRRCASGVYYARLKAGGIHSTRKMSLVQ
jgi:hypothetical protein